MVVMVDGLGQFQVLLSFFQKYHTSYALDIMHIVHMKDKYHVLVVHSLPEKNNEGLLANTEKTKNN